MDNNNSRNKTTLVLSYVLIFLVFVLIFNLAIFKVRSYDIWSFLKTGQYILETKTIPQQDIFSHTAETQRWVCYQWGSSALFFTIYCLAGLNGLVIFKAAVITLAFVILFLAIRLFRVNLVINLAIVLLSAFVCRERFFLRHEIFSYIFLSLLLYLVYQYKYSNRNRLYFIPVIMLIWANLHTGAILGALVLIIFTLCEYMATRLKFLSPDSENLCLAGKFSHFRNIAVCGIIAAFINPYTYELFLEPLRIGASSYLRQNITELLPQNILASPALLFTLIAFIAVTVIHFKKVNLTQFCLAIIFTIIGLSAKRLLFFWIIVIGPLLAKYLSDWEFFPSHRFRIKYRPTAIAAILAVAYLLITAPRNDPRFIYGFGAADYLPTDACAFIAENNLPGKVFNTTSSGSYFIWKFYPRRKVFSDLRLSVYGEKFWKEVYNPIRFGAPGWQKLLDKYDITYTLTDTSDEKINRRLAKSPDWRLIYLDKNYFIHIRNTPQNEALITKYSYTAIDLFSKAGYKEGGMEKAIVEYEQLIAQSPLFEIPYLNLGVLYSQKKQFSKAISIYKKVLEINPRLVDGHYNLGYFYQQKNAFDEAKKSYLKALGINPRHTDSRNSLGIIYSQEGDYKQAAAEFKKAKSHYNLGLCFSKMGRYAQAIDAYNTALAESPDSAEIHGNLGIAYYQQGRKQEAIKEFKRVLEINPEDRVAQQNLKMIE